MPGGALKLLPGRRFNWYYETEPQAQAGGRRLYWPRGKVVGGSSAINALLYARGHRADYDAWAAAGNGGWSYDEVLPYFKKSETHVRPIPLARDGRPALRRASDIRDRSCRPISPQPRRRDIGDGGLQRRRARRGRHL